MFLSTSLKAILPYAQASLFHHFMQIKNYNLQNEIRLQVTIKNKPQQTHKIYMNLSSFTFLSYYSFNFFAYFLIILSVFTIS